MTRPKRVPQRRNKLTGTGKRASAKKKKYDAKFHSTRTRKTYRARLNKANKNSPNKKGFDKSHTKKGNLVNERQGKNRARNKRGRSRK